MKKESNIITMFKWVLGLFIAGAVLFGEACVSPETNDDFAPLGAPSCEDGKLNQGEYQTDCGGPCKACPNIKKELSATFDSTWVHDTSKTLNRFWTPGNLEIYNDTFLGNQTRIFGWDSINIDDKNFPSTGLVVQFNFFIDKTWPVGIHEIDSTFQGNFYTNVNYDLFEAGTVYVEGGIVKITNRDDVNKLVTGEFEFNLSPDPFTGLRVRVIDGKFKDIPIQ